MEKFQDYYYINNDISYGFQLHNRKGEDGIHEAAMFGRNVHVVVDDDLKGRPLIQELLEAKGVPVTSLERVSPSLEDVFVALIQEEGGAVEG